MTIVFSDEESALLDTIAIDTALEALPPLKRDLIRCLYQYGDPPNGERCWPSTYRAIGQFLGRAHARRPLSAMGVHKYRIAIHTRWAHLHQSSRSDMFHTVRMKYLPTVIAVATVLGRHDPDLIEDLRQEGDIALWRVGPKKWDEVPYCNAAIRSAMLDFCRREQRQARNKAQALGELPARGRVTRKRRHRRREGLCDAGQRLRDGRKRHKAVGERVRDRRERL